MDKNPFGCDDPKKLWKKTVLTWMRRSGKGTSSVGFAGFE